VVCVKSNWKYDHGRKRKVPDAFKAKNGHKKLLFS